MWPQACKSLWSHHVLLADLIVQWTVLVIASEKLVAGGNKAAELPYWPGLRAAS